MKIMSPCYIQMMTAAKTCNRKQLQSRSSYLFSARVDQTLTEMLLAMSEVDATTPENSNGNDDSGLCRWTTAEAHGKCSADVNNELSTAREVAESTRSGAGLKQCSSYAPSTYCFSYSDLVGGGYVRRPTFNYVPDNRAYSACRAAARTRLKLQRCGVGRSRRTRGARGGDSDGAMSVQGSSFDEQLLASRYDVAAVAQRSSNDSDSLSEHADAVDARRQAESCDHHDVEGDGDLATACRNNSAATSSDYARRRADSVLAEREPRRPSERRHVKTWLYNFLPPIATGEAEPRRPAADARAHDLPPPSKSQNKEVAGRRRPNAERRRAVAGRRSATSDADGAIRRRAGDVDRRRRLDETSYDCQIYFTATCLLPHCDCGQHHEDSDDGASSSVAASHVDDLNDDSTDGHCSINDIDEEDRVAEDLGAAVGSFLSRPNELVTEHDSTQLQPPPTAQVTDNTNIMSYAYC